MNLLDVVILAIVEGITEYLPISSTGHLILTAKLLSIEPTNFVKSFEIAIQSGALLGVLILYWKRIIGQKRLLKTVFVGFLPAATIGFIFYHFIKSYLLGNSAITLLSLFIGGILLIVLELMYKEKDHHVSSVENISSKQAFLIGLFQTISIIPGVSRAGATIIGALFLGIKRKPAVEFSFLLAIPTLFAATALDLVKNEFKFSPNELFMMILGMIISCLVAMSVVKWFISYIQTKTFIPFGIYRIILAIVFWLIIK